jgi:hypothetical protein
MVFGDFFFASDDVAAILRASDFKLDVEDFPDFVTRTFVRDATRVAAGFRAGLAVRVTPMDVGKLPCGGTDTAEFLVVRSDSSPRLDGSRMSNSLH